MVSTMSMPLAHPGFIVLVCMRNQDFLPNLEWAQLPWHLDRLRSLLQRPAVAAVMRMVLSLHSCVLQR